MEITEKSFWENYWGDIKLPLRVDLKFKNDRIITEVIKKNIPQGNENKRALEIGRAPGKWMLFLCEKLNYSVDGFEYLEIAAEKTRENFEKCGIPNSRFKVITADFLTQIPTPMYDLVISLGFIEHFENYQDVFQKHIAYTKKGGYVIIGFPNFKGLNYLIQYLIDKIAGSQIIANHNLLIMDKEVIHRLVLESECKEVFIDYIGGFEPALFNAKDIKNPLLRFVFKLTLKFLAVIFNHTRFPYVASYFIVVFKND